jgi:integrase/recombinase XerD
MLIADLLDRYLNHQQFIRSDPIRPQTVASLRRRFNILKSEWHGLDISELTMEHVYRLRKSMLERNCSLGYIANILSIIRAFLRYLETELEIRTIDYSRIRLPARPRSEVKYLTPDQLRKYIFTIDVRTIYGIRLMAIVAALLDSGMRISELLSLDRSIMTEWRETDGGMTAFVVGKGNKKRMVMFRAWSIGWIKRYLEMRDDDHPALFVTRMGTREATRLSDGNLRKRYFEPLAKKTGLEVTPHTLRRTAATTMWANGGDVRLISKFLGHSKLAVTEAYLGTDWEAVRRMHGAVLTYGESERGFSSFIQLWDPRGKFPACLECGKTDRPHAGKGLCSRCYGRLYMQKKHQHNLTDFTIPFKLGG